MSESGDYNPGPWRGYDFGRARRTYDRHVGRSYQNAVKIGKNRDELVKKTLTTKSESPLVIACDVTGSMEDWPATIFSKLPYLDLEGKEYMGQTMRVSFAAVGDAHCDLYPLQTKSFCIGRTMEKNLKDLIIEGGGGGQQKESYELAALYYARNVNMSNAINPMFIFIADEGIYNFVDKQQAEEWARTSIQGRMSAKDVIDELKRKFSVYVIRKPYSPYGRDNTSPADKKIQRQWESLVGADHVAILPQAQRVVDVIFGLMAQETQRIDYFTEELTERQKPEQVNVVLKSLHSIHGSASHSRVR